MNWDWISGFMEGEGHIYWQLGKKGTNQGTSGRIIIGQKCPKPLEAMRQFLLGEGLSNPILYYRPASPKAERSSGIWILVLNRRDDVIAFLKHTIAGLYEKREKAQSVLEKLAALRKKRDDALTLAFELRKDGLTWHEVARQSGIGRVALSNYARSAGIELPVHKGFENQKSWRDDRIARGLCEKCGNPRGKDGTTRKCRRCADAYNAWRNEHRRKYGRKDRASETRS